MPNLFDPADGELLSLDDYFDVFDKDLWSITEGGFWKLERQQFFREPSNESWRAFAEGDWDEALRLIEAGRDELVDYHRKVAEHDFTASRVRVVEFPIIPYVQWELHALRLRAETGALIRVIGPERVAELEHDGQLPEFATLGSRVLYEPVYDEHGVLSAGRRFQDRDLVRRCQQLTRKLFDEGEPLASFFEREVAPLPPPRP
jgi:hypothetical protein